MIVVFGASGFLGKEVCKYFHNQGKKVIAVFRNESDRNKDHDNCYTGFTYFDIDNSSSAEGFKGFEEEYDEPINLVVNCIGTLSYKKLMDMTVDDFVGTLTINTIIPELITQSYLDYIDDYYKCNAGDTVVFNLVHIASLAYKIPITFGAHYCSSKAALAMLVKCLGKEIDEHYKLPLSVCCISPGMISESKMEKDNIKRLTELKGMSYDAAVNYNNSGKFTSVESVILVIDSIANGKLVYSNGYNFEL